MNLFLHMGLKNTDICQNLIKNLQNIQKMKSNTYLTHIYCLHLEEFLSSIYIELKKNISAKKNT